MRGRSVVSFVFLFILMIFGLVESAPAATSPSRSGLVLVRSMVVVWGAVVSPFVGRRVVAGYLASVLMTLPVVGAPYKTLVSIIRPAQAT